MFGDVPVRQQTAGEIRGCGVEWSAYGAVWQGARLGVGGGVCCCCFLCTSVNCFLQTLAGDRHHVCDEG